MIMLLVIGTFAASVALAFVRAVLVDELRAICHRRIGANVERTIGALPPDVRHDWAEEWRAELATLNSTPLSAMRFARGLSGSAADLVCAAGLPPITRPSARRRTKARAKACWVWSQHTREGIMLTGPPVSAMFGYGIPAWLTGTGVIRGGGPAGLAANCATGVLLGLGCGVTILGLRSACMAVANMWAKQRVRP